MNEINKVNKIRHSLAHLLASAVLKLYPDAKNTIGPAIDNGFYYDFEFSTPVGDKDLKKIENKMREIIKDWDNFSHQKVSLEEALKWAGANEYKIELINEIDSKGEEITLYTSGDFTDLCRGGHIDSMREIPSDSWKIVRTAGAYWRGDEKNKMLTRIYGLAFESKQELDEYEAKMIEAEKRDHKKLGKELDIFVFSDLVGSGLPLWTPKGTIIRHLLDNFVGELRNKYGYQKVEIPHITKKDLYMKSGHWDKFKDELFKIKTREGHEFAMKPMNCPHHTQIYARKQWSYKELPQRYANTTTCYRDEQSGELSGLSRVRSFAQDDAHVFCRVSQTKEEFLKVWDIVHSFYPAFGFKLKVRLSLHDPEHFEKYLGDRETWKRSEDMLREIIKEKDTECFEGIGEAAFYGPKLDFMAVDAIGRPWQVATIQLDMNLPERFDLYCINEKSEKERIVMIHAAIMGSIERFMSILIEHTAGKLPLWLSPTQVSVIPVRESNFERVKEVTAELVKQGLRAEAELGDTNFGKKIREAKNNLVPYTIIIGDKDMEKGVVTVENRDSGSLGQKTLEEITKTLVLENKDKR